MSICLLSCGHYKPRAYPAEMMEAKIVLIKDPHRALLLLTNLRSKINKEPEETRMYYALLLFRAQDMCYVTHKSEQVINTAIAYYKKNGDNDKLMAAYYCLGCYYRDQNDYIKATDSYQKALGFVAQSKDYSLIGRIYNQLAELNRFPNEALALYKMSAKYFDRADDRRTLAYSLRDIAAEYQSLEKYDSALTYGLRAYQIIEKNEDDRHIMENELANYYLLMGNYKKARFFLERASRKMKRSNDLSLNYFNWGYLYQHTNKMDSAIYYLDKCIKIDNIDNKYYSYVSLHDIYKQIGNKDKALYCAEMMSTLEEDVRRISHDEVVTNVNAYYDFSRTKKEIRQLNVENKYKNISLITIFTVTVILGIVGFFRIKSVLKEKEERHRSCIKEVNAKYNDGDNALDEVVQFFHNAAYTGQAITDLEWKDLMDAVDVGSNDFYQHILSLYPKIKPVELKVCYLLKAGFFPAEIAKLTQRSPNGISSIRCRLYTKFTQKKGVSKDLDNLLKDF